MALRPRGTCKPRRHPAKHPPIPPANASDVGGFGPRGSAADLATSSLSAQHREIRGQRVGRGSGVAKVAEYRAIFGGAGPDLRLLGALQMKISLHIANRRDGCTIHAVLEVNKKIPINMKFRLK